MILDRKRARWIASLFLLTTFIACMNRPATVEKLWFYTHSNGNVSVRDTILNPACYLSLKKDGSYTYDLDRFSYGTWKREENKIYFTEAAGKRSSVTITSLSANEMLLEIEDFAPAYFESQPAKFPSAAENPFSIENNRWRVAPTNKESDSELRLRLLNHLHFWELYFNWALTNELSTIDVRSAPTLIKVYGNGFALKTADDLPLKWKACFYDEADCLRANEIMKTIFQRSNIAWAHTDNKYKMFISAFQQLQQQVRLEESAK